jgi:hypothetical protein
LHLVKHLHKNFNNGVFACLRVCISFGIYIKEDNVGVGIGGHLHISHHKTVSNFALKEANRLSAVVFLFAQ